MRRAALGSEPGAAALNSRLRDLALKTEELGLRVWITQTVFIADSLGITNVEESVSWLLKMGDEKLIPAAMIRHAPAAVQIDLIPHVESRLREEGSEADEVYWVLTAGHAEAVAMVQRLEREGLLTGCAAEIARNQVYFEDMCYW